MQEDDAPFDFKAWREAKGLSYRATARVFGVALSTIQEWEKRGADKPIEWACYWLNLHPETISQRAPAKPPLFTRGGTPGVLDGLTGALKKS
ncbi:helix-turn-helix domain-containing protein [Nitrospirillum iridis]|uniref:Transcriptional regulator with XRE-family HTH domain n=1 Tax=Nitrospirillum iridis TaxID=765888 RepID=A0A7X0EEG5_9PROT|nr:hypothetical protein [Nitrospirillum iridis]MBB6253005.1 transcriptional regulator with XRE-family HTH domain [Nitrospirillum iridis]